MRVAGHVRVSTEGQAEEGWSLDAQERAITLHAGAHGWEVVAWYRDEGKSARVDDLP
jgi:site-specific DNA recombinase